MSRLIIASLIALISVSSMASRVAQGEVLFADDFYYLQPTKTLGPGGGFQRQDYGGGQNGTSGRWTNRWVSVGNSIIVGSDILDRVDEFPDLNPDTDIDTALTQGGLSAQFLQRDFEFNGLPSNQTLYFAISTRTVTEDASPATLMQINAPGSDNRQIGMGMMDGGFQAVLGSETAADFETTNDTAIHRLIGKLQINAAAQQERLTVWLDPTGVETGGTKIEVSADVLTSINELAGGVQLLGAEPRVFWDDVVVGTTWNDVAAVSVPRLTLQVDPDSGSVALINESSQPMTINYYELLSANGLLDPIGWQSIDGEVADDGAWVKNLGTVDPQTRLVESNFTGGTLLAPQTALRLGKAFKPNSPLDRDLIARVGTRDGLLNVAEVRYEPLSVLGDFDGDGNLDAPDLDLQADVMVKQPSPLPAGYDLNNDGAVDFADREVWLHDLKNVYVGDADLNGEFTSADFVQVFIAGKYETGQKALWEEGDWDGDQLFNSADFVAAFVDGGYEQGPRTNVAAVPEPAAWTLLAIGLPLWLIGCRIRRAP